jgi:hypothetical protein
MSDIRLTMQASTENPVLYDWQISDHTLQFVGTDNTDVSDKRAELLQCVLTSLMQIRGEWYLNLKDGFPYKDRIFSKGITESMAKILVSRYIRQIPGVARVTVGNVTIDRAARSMTVSNVVIKADSGITLRASDFDVPYLVLVDQLNRLGT